MRKVLLAATLVAILSGASARGDARMDIRRDATVRAVEKAAPAVVNISTEEIVRRGFFYGDEFFGDDPFFRQFVERFGTPMVANSLGSGGIFTPDGFVFTNAHVVNRASKIMVTLNDGSQHTADLVNVDLANDVAVIRISRAKPFPTLVLGRSDDLMVGEKAIAVGNPFGLSNTVTSGVISALHREAAAEGRTLFKDLLQTDAVINPGNSGGPLLNVFGEVIGVNSAMAAGAQGIGFAIPVDAVKKSLSGLLDYRRLRRIRLGIGLKEQYTGTGPEAVLVVTRVEGVSAKAAGLAPGDVVTSVSGRPISSMVDFMAAVLLSPEGALRITAARGSEDISAVIAPVAIPKPDGAALAMSMMGLSVRQMDASLVRTVGIEVDQGIVVTRVAAGSTGEKTGLEPNDIILQVNDTLTSDMGSFAAALEAGADGGTVSLVIIRRTGRVIRQYGAEVEIMRATKPLT